MKIKIAIVIFILILFFVIYKLLFTYTRQNIRDLLRRSLTGLNSVDIDYCITYGTLLGYHRENDVIYGDGDGDIMMNGTEDNITKLLSVNWGSLGLRLIKINDCSSRFRDVETTDASNVTLYRLKYKDDRLLGKHVDVYIMDTSQTPDGIKCNIRPKDDFCHEINIDDIYPTRTVIFLDTSCKIPNNPHNMLSLFYGKDYMTPKFMAKSPVKCDMKLQRAKYCDYNKFIISDDKLRLYNPLLKFTGFNDKIIHQTWKTDSLTDEQLQRTNTWKQNYPDWEYILWTDDMIDEFVADKFGWFLPIWNLLDPFIKKVDCVRYMWMYEFGGMYTDLDTVSKKPISPLLNWNAAYIPVVSTSINWNKDSDSASPAFLISNRKNKFWLYMLLYVANNYYKKVLEATGPIALANTIKYINDNNIPLDIVFITEKSVGIGSSKRKGKYSYHINTTTWSDNKTYPKKGDDKAINGVSSYIQNLIIDS